MVEPERLGAADPNLVGPEPFKELERSNIPLVLVVKPWPDRRRNYAWIKRISGLTYWLNVKAVFFEGVKTLADANAAREILSWPYDSDWNPWRGSRAQIFPSPSTKGVLSSPTSAAFFARWWLLREEGSLLGGPFLSGRTFLGRRTLIGKADLHRN